MTFTKEEIRKETKRLWNKLKKLHWDENDCKLNAPLTLEINRLKKEKDAIILAHSYQTPDIVYGVADFVGDSYELSVKASKHPAKTVIFCSVYFMGETAKILSPEKEVIVPLKAGCSLAESIQAKDVKKMRKKYPAAGIVCYVNTTAAVKAECDACCTSANALKIVEAMPQKNIIFFPDKLMGENLKAMTKKKIILWDGTCIVHELFHRESVDEIRKQYPKAKILAHPECAPEVIKGVDFVGGTSEIIKYIKNSKTKRFMILTECGIADRIQVEEKNREIVGTCNICPYMKEISLRYVLKALKNPSKDQIVKISKTVISKAKKSLDNMFELEKKLWKCKF